MDKLVLEFKNGDDVHFNYSSQADAPSNTVEQSLSSKRKKKKKKKKSGSSSTAPQFSLGDATLNDPDADYPESRVIKFDADGNVVVESLDVDYGAQPTDSHVQPRTIEQVKPTKFSVFHFNNDDEKNFWDNLPLQSKREIVDLSPYTVIQKIREQMKQHYNSESGPERTLDRLRGCPCCGRISFHIEKEIEAAYHLDVQLIWNYVEDFKRDTFEDLKITPQYAMDRSFLRQKEHRSPSPAGLPVEPPAEISPDEVHLNTSASKENVATDGEAEVSNESPDENFGTNEHEMDFDNLPATEGEKETLMGLSLEDLDRAKSMFQGEIHNEEELRSRVKFLKCLKKEFMDRYKVPPMIPKTVLESIKLADNSSPPNYSLDILNSLGIFTGEDSGNKGSRGSDKISAFADLILDNNGRYFVDILESLIKEDGEKGPQIEEIDEESPELEHYALKSPIDDEITQQNLGYLIRPPGPISNVHNLNNGGGASDPKISDKHFDQIQSHQVDRRPSDLHDHDHNNEHEHHHNCNRHHDDEDGEDVEEYASDYEEDYDYHHDCEHHQDCDHDCHHECDHDEHYDEESEQESDEENEYFQQKRREEIRGFFLIQAVSIIRQNFHDSYERKISEDRTQKFIEELEAEENAKKEREVKKLKQKEKQKEKKRLQQLQKEEEKKLKEEEELKKATEIKRKRDELRAEQLRRKEELRLKKEEEKLKKIEALKKKEMEQQKLAEQRLRQQEEQRKKEAESREAARKEAEKKEAERKAAEEKEAKKREAENAARIRAAEDKKAQEAELFAKQKLADDRLSSQEELVRKPPPGLYVPDIIKTLMVEPVAANNHLLDQLYQARPRSTSSTSSFTQQMPSLSNSVYSPSKQNNQQIDHMSWGTDTSINLHGQPLPTQTNAVFSPFGESNTGTDQWSTSQFSDPFLTSKPVLTTRASTAGNSGWGGAYSSRNTSIWNSNPATTASGSNLWSSPVSQNAGLMVGSHPAMGNEAQDASLIQAAASDAFNALQSSGQVTFGMAPAVLLFQTTKALLKNASFGMAEFLGTLRTGGLYQFDFVYDDFGSVTHIKVNTLNSNTTPPMPMRAPLQPILSQMQPPITPRIQSQPLQNQPIQTQPIQSQQLHTQPLLPPNLPIQQGFLQQSLQHLLHLAPLNLLTHLVHGASFPQTQFSDNQEAFAANFQANSASQEQLNYDINLPGSVQGLLNQLGFAQTRGSIW